MRVLSLFDGMSCGRIALERIGITPEVYYASEIDKYATIVSEANYPDIVRLGDVTKWAEWDIDWESIDLILAGSPCQGFSFAGKQLAFEDPRSALFFTFEDILATVRFYNPRVKFLLENVKMKKEHLDVISQRMGVDPVFINSALVSAQNRQRYYWCNWPVTQPSDRGVVLSDILESEGEGHLKNHGKWKPKSDKSQYIDANYHKGADNHGQRTLILQRGRGNNPGGLRALDGKTPSLTSNSWENNNHLITGAEIRTRGFETIQSPGKSYAITASANTGGKALITEGSRYRKLTPIECERLQTVPDNFTNHVSNTQRYKMLGNGWTVDVIAHILSEAGL